MASYQFINPLFKNITYHILSLPLAMRFAKDERRNAACLFIDDAIKLPDAPPLW